MPDFKVFTKRMVPLTKRPYVTIQKKGYANTTASGTITTRVTARAILSALVNRRLPWSSRSSRLELLARCMSGSHL